MSSIQARRRGVRAAVEVAGWYWPELGLTAGLITAGVIWWWPLGVFALVPAAVRARDVAQQLAYREQFAAYVAAIEAAKAEQDQPPVRAWAARTDVTGPAAIEAGGAEQ